jgi:hypothetical protein
VTFQSFPLSQLDDVRAESAQSIRSELLRRDVFLETERVDTRELARVTVRRQGVVSTRGVVTATAT